MRPATAEECERVQDALDALTGDQSLEVLGDSAVAVLGEGRVSLVSTGAFALPSVLLEGADAGLVIGTLEDGDFHLDLQGAVRVAAVTRKNCVRVREKVARLYLYGRGVLAPSVLDYDRKLRPGDVCIVTDPRREALGMGTVVGGFKGNREVVHPLHDLGRYLRDQDAA